MCCFMDREELLGKYVAGERDFRGVILQYISLDGVKLEGVNFTGAIFNAVSFKTTLIDSEDISQGFNEPIFVNCNFSCSEWWVCRLPKLVGCNFQYSTMEGCYLFDRFVDCDWRYSQIQGCYWDDLYFRGMRFQRNEVESRICSNAPNSYWGLNNGKVLTLKIVFSAIRSCQIAKCDRTLGCVRERNLTSKTLYVELLRY